MIFLAAITLYLVCLIINTHWTLEKTKNFILLLAVLWSCLKTLIGGVFLAAYYFLRAIIRL